MKDASEYSFIECTKCKGQGYIIDEFGEEVECDECGGQGYFDPDYLEEDPDYLYEQSLDL